MLNVHLLETFTQKVFPKKSISLLGRSITLKCYSTSNVKWKFNHTKLPLKLVKSRGVNPMEYKLIINNINFSNAGIYTCQGEYNNHKFESSATLKVVGKY